MLLRELFRSFDPKFDTSRLPDVRVTSITEDSRRVGPGSVFVARAGTRIDGAKFVDDAARRGAVVVVSAQTLPGCPLPVVVVPDAGAAGSILAHLLHCRPSRAMKVVGVTGTNGKTTTAYLLRHVLASVGHKCGMVGTVQIDDGGPRPRPADMTTPGAVEVAGLMARMVANGCSACAMETSSHALHQGRVAGVHFAAGVFTNLTGDHLDYHGDMDAYAAAKATLFEGLDGDAVAIVNADCPFAPRMTQRCPARVITFGMKEFADYTARDIATTAAGTNFVLVGPDGTVEVRMRLIGRHNVENALAAAATCAETFGMNVHQIAAGLRTAAGAPGRLQQVQHDQPFTVLIDYAHTDDALRNVLASLRPLCRGALRVVFGCGGDRDRTKRPRMAAVACELADAVYITSDNPRTEPPRAIIEQILAGVPTGARGKVQSEADRRAAIFQAIADAAPGDIVLIAGKGHEDYQVIGETREHFDDAEVAALALRAVHAPGR